MFVPQLCSLLGFIGVKIDSIVCLFFGRGGPLRPFCILEHKISRSWPLTNVINKQIISIHFLIFKPLPNTSSVYYLVFFVRWGNGQRTHQVLKCKLQSAAVRSFTANHIALVRLNLEAGNGHCAPIVILATFDCDPAQFWPICLCRNNSQRKCGWNRKDDQRGLKLLSLSSTMVWTCMTCSQPMLL